MIRFRCPCCWKQLKAPAGKAGKSARCPSCYHQFSIPQEEIASPTADPIVPVAQLPAASGPAVPSVKPTVSQLPLATPIQPDRQMVLNTAPAPPLLKIHHEVVPATPKRVVRFYSDGTIALDIADQNEAKLAIAELKLKKQELALKKREVMDEMRRIRAEYTDYVRRRGSKFQGGGGVGRIIRAFETMSRDDIRRRLAQELEPFELERRDIDNRMLEIDHAILEAKQFS